MRECDERIDEAAATGGRYKGVKAGAAVTALASVLRKRDTRPQRGAVAYVP